MIAEAREWLEQAEYDFPTAKAMFNARKYTYTIYMCQLTLEKALKAIVTQRTGEAPPRTHKLLSLAEIARIKPTKDHLEFLGIMDAIGTGARYPKDLAATRKAYSREFTKGYLAGTGELLEWLKRKLTSEL
ncbi:MAG: HEPN domain-containing protein [Firmicutes bacterium]|nr:HEPN domain-containing protein [Bacillota bacterium]